MKLLLKIQFMTLALAWMIIPCLHAQGPPGGFQTTTPTQLFISPFFVGADGAAYYFVQNGNRVYWAAEHSGQHHYCHVGEGIINETSKTIKGTWWSVPKYKATETGTVTFQVVLGGSLQVITQTGGFPTTPLNRRNLTQDIIDIFPKQEQAAYTAHTQADLDGVWVASMDPAERVVYVRQIGSKVLMFGESKFTRPALPTEAFVFIGDRSGNNVNGVVAMVPKGKKNSEFSKASFEVTGENSMRQESGYRITNRMLIREFPQRFQDDINDFIRSTPNVAMTVNGGSNVRNENKGNYDDNGRQVCRSIKVDIKHNFEKIGLLAESSAIYPGNIILLNGKAKTGDVESFNKLPRAPVKLIFPNVSYISDCADGQGGYEVKDPGQSSIEGKIDKMMRCALGKGFRSTNNWELWDEVSYSSKQTALEISLQANIGYFGAEAGYFQASSSSRKTYYTIFNQVFYRVAVEAPSNPAQWFAKYLSLADFKAQYSPGSFPLGYISEVSYGRTVVMMIETDSKYSERQIKAALNYMNTAEVSAEYKDLFTSGQTTVRIRALGGASAVFTGTNPASYRSQLNAFLEKYDNYSISNNGLPIGYKVAYLKNNKTVPMGSAVNYTKEECFTNSTIKFEHDGAYNAAFHIYWKVPGSDQELMYDSGVRSMGWQETRQVPGNATYIRVRGIAYRPSKTELFEHIYERSELPLQKKFRSKGLATNIGYSESDF